MTTINQLSALSAVTAGDQLPVFSTSNGDARKCAISVLAAYLAAGGFSDGLEVVSYVKVEPVTVANLPSAATAGAGATAFVTDASSGTFGATVSGGGSNAVPVHSDGTDWKVG